MLPSLAQGDIAPEATTQTSMDKRLRSSDQLGCSMIHKGPKRLPPTATAASHISGDIAGIASTSMHMHAHANANSNTSQQAASQAFGVKKKTPKYPHNSKAAKAAPPVICFVTKMHVHMNTLAGEIKAGG